MTEPTFAQKQLAEALLEEHGQTLAGELGLSLSQNRPGQLFQMLVAALLLSARIQSGLAMSAAKALNEAGWTTAKKMAASTWDERVKVLNGAGYARYDEKTASMLGDAVALLIDKYKGDLRKLREEARREPGAERELLKAFKGIGDTGVDIFFREVQAVWDELFPFADKKTLKAANRLGLGANAEDLTRLVDKENYAALVAGLVRLDIANDYKRLRGLAA